MISLYTTIVSILFGLGLYAIYYNINFMKFKTNKDLEEVLIKTHEESEKQEKEIKDNIDKYNVSNIKEKKEENNVIDETRIFKKIDNSKYEIPIDNAMKIDPRKKMKNTLKFDCPIRKKHDLLIEDDYKSMDPFNDNCDQPISDFTQETNNLNISKEMLQENPQFYDTISQNL